MLANSQRQRDKKPQRTIPYEMWSTVFLLCISLQFTSVSVVRGFFIQPDEHQPDSHGDWSYDRQSEWVKSGRQCNQSSQSPVNIDHKSVRYNKQLRLHFYNYDQPTRFKIQNAHHTIKLDPVAGSAFGVKLEGGESDAATEHSMMNFLGVDYAESVLEREADQSSNQNQPRPSSTSGGQRGGRTNAGNNDNGARSGRLNLGSQQQQAGNGGHQSFEGNSLDESRRLGNGGVGEPLAYNGAPTIKLDWLEDGYNEFRLVDIHFHWGERRDSGSEHAIDGNKSAMEMHLVHIRHGLEKAEVQHNPDSLTVISVLIESYKKSNADFNPIVSALNSINMTNQAQEIEYKSINDLLPNSLDRFYTYRGSLTTPPCFQVVNWIVMSERLLLHAKHIELFRNLYSTRLARQRSAGVSPISSASPSSNGFHGQIGDDSNHDLDQLQQQQHHHHHQQQQPRRLHESLVHEVVPIMPNIRQIQPLNNRTIMSSFEPRSRLLHSGSSTSIKTTLGVGSSILIWAMALICTSSMLQAGH